MLEARAACGVCGTERAEAFYPGEGRWGYNECKTCGTFSLEPPPSQEELSAFYNQTYSVPAEAYARGTQRSAPPILRSLAGRIPAKGKLLEVGCSYGFFLDAARQEGWQTAGIEIDDGAASYGRDKLGLNIFSGTLESEFARLEPPYDAITTFHVIEHVRDPLHFLRLCRELLKENGVLILKTPNVASWIAKKTGAHWQWLCPPAHIHLFTPRSLELALERSGFRVEKTGTQRGDAHNNLFELACAAGRYVRSRRNGAPANGNGRKSWSDRWQVNAAQALSEALYAPVGTLADPWLGKKGLQPELLAIARG